MSTLIIVGYSTMLLLSLISKLLNVYHNKGKSKSGVHFCICATSDFIVIGIRIILSDTKMYIKIVPLALKCNFKTLAYFSPVVNFPPLGVRPCRKITRLMMVTDTTMPPQAACLA